MNIIIGIICWVIAIMINQWMVINLKRDALDRIYFFTTAWGKITFTIIQIILEIVGLYFFYMASIWVAIIVAILFILLISSNVKKNKQ